MTKYLKSRISANPFFTEGKEYKIVSGDYDEALAEGDNVISNETSVEIIDDRVKSHWLGGGYLRTRFELIIK